MSYRVRITLVCIRDEGSHVLKGEDAAIFADVCRMLTIPGDLEPITIVSHKRLR